MSKQIKKGTAVISSVERQDIEGQSSFNYMEDNLIIPGEKHSFSPLGFRSYTNYPQKTYNRDQVRDTRTPYKFDSLKKSIKPNYPKITNG